MRFGVTLVFALDMKKLAFCNLWSMKERYNILCKGRRIYTSLSEEEYFNIMEDLSIEYYQTGSPKPEDLETEILMENQLWQKADH